MTIQERDVAEDAWDLPAPFRVSVRAEPQDVDAFNHVNNAVYLRWLEEAAWAHSESLGLSQERCVALDRGMVAARTEVIYVRPAQAGDALVVGTWIISNDGRLSSDRRYHVVRPSDGATIARARTRFVCVALSTGAPARPPAEFSVYVPIPDVQTALSDAPWKEWPA